MGKERWLKIQYVRFQKNEPEQRNTGVGDDDWIYIFRVNLLLTSAEPRRKQG